MTWTFFPDAARGGVGRWRAALAVGALALAAAADAQVAPTGDHYGARAMTFADAGDVSAQGAFAASVPLDLPASRAGLPVPITITYGEHRVGAAGLGWELPLSYVQWRDLSDVARFRPMDTPNDYPEAGERAILFLAGQRFDLADISGALVPRRGASNIKLIWKTDGSGMTAYDGAGLTYHFSHDNAPALIDAGIMLLRDITTDGGARVHLDYAIASPTSIAGGESLTIDLTQVSYNPHPTTDGCYKHAVAMNYNADLATPIAIEMVGSRVLARRHTLASIDVNARADCASAATALRRYQFNYLAGGDPDTRLPRLQSVTMTGRAGTAEANTTLPVASYGYGSATVNGTLKYSSGGAPAAPTLGAQSGTASNALPPLPMGTVSYYSSNPFLDFSGDGRADAGGFAAAPGAAAQKVVFTGQSAAMPVHEAHALTHTRFDPNMTVAEDRTWREAVDINGDGRLDLIDASEQAHAWVVYLNAVDPGNYNNTQWQRRVISIDDQIAALAQAGLMPAGSDKLPLSFRRTERSPSVERTRTWWKLIDLNGDGYPDFVYGNENTRLMAALNVAGPRLLRAPENATEGAAFGSTMVVRDGVNDRCGVERWEQEGSTQIKRCGFIDVNGDGMMDRVQDGTVYLGAGSLRVTFGNDGQQFTRLFATLPSYKLPDNRTGIEEQSSNALTYCKTNAPGANFSVSKTTALVDLNGDGIVDYVRQNPASVWQVWFGTGTGFAAPVSIQGSSFALSYELETCAGTSSRVLRTLADLDGDGKPEAFFVNDPSSAQVNQLVGSTGVAGAAEVGRLIKVDNGYGAVTTIGYASAKADTTTPHQLPYPEIVVASVRTTGERGLGGDLAEHRYAYGGATRHFDATRDAFVFPGYRVQVDLLVPGQATDKGLAMVTTTYALPKSLGTITRNERYGRYLVAGRTRDVVTLADRVVAGGGHALGTNPRALLEPFYDYFDATTADDRVIANLHRTWNTRLVAASAVGASDACWDLFYPYDYEASRTHDTSQGDDDAHANFDLCRAQGFSYEQSTQVDRGDFTAAAELKATVRTYRDTRSVDDYGRVTSAADYGDYYRDDDDVCIATSYATPTGSTARVLSAVASRTIRSTQLFKSCDAADAITLAKTSWTYDGLPAGSVSAGRVTGEDVERRDALGTVLATLHSFDATYNAQGKLATVTRTRDDGAKHQQTLSYDAFALSVTTQTQTATQADGSALPTQTTTDTRDPLSLDLTANLDANGTRRGASYDGFGRVVFDLIKPAGGSEGVTAVTSYDGFVVGASGGRQITRKVFTDAVPSANAPTATGRVSTVFLDELARPRRTEAQLGADYGTEKLIVGERRYDSWGRVSFAADPYPASQSASTAYGTTSHFAVDGSRRCDIRGNGVQALTEVTSESVERYPTCYSHQFRDNTERFGTRRPDALLAGSAQVEVMRVGVLDATGRLLARWTEGANVFGEPSHLEDETFAYDRLGHLTTMMRYGKPKDFSPAANPVSTTWSVDSLGWVTAFVEPGAPTQSRAYDNWGQLTETRWTDATSGTAVERAIVSRYDALGRLVHSEERKRVGTGAESVDAETVYDYAYDIAATAVPRVSPTFVLGRLAQATSPTSKIVLSYDALGRVNARGDNDLHGNTYIQRVALHTDGTPITNDLNLPDNGYVNERVSYAYDSAGRLTQAVYSDPTTTAKTLYAASTIDAFGRVRAASYGPSSYAASYADTGRRLVSNVAVTAPNGLGMRQFAFTGGFDAMGRERSRQEVINNAGVVSTRVATYAYDALGRLDTSSTTLAGATQAQWRYVHDALGNTRQAIDQLGANDATMSYQDLDRDRLCRIDYGDGAAASTACNVVHDGVGNVITQPARGGGTRSYEYLASGLVRAIANSSGAKAKFRYGALGELEQLDVTSALDSRADRHFGALVFKRDELVGGVKKQVITRSFRAPGLVATRHGPLSTDPWTFVFGEARGNRFVTDENGAFVQDIAYQPFGEASSTGAAIGSPRYTSAQWNGGDTLAAFGINRLGARLYDPVIGRFLARDPLVIPRTASTTNPYAFAANDPINASDPSGLTEVYGSGTWKTGPRCETCGGGGGGNPGTNTGGPGGDAGGGGGEGTDDAPGDFGGGGGGGGSDTGGGGLGDLGGGVLSGGVSGGGDGIGNYGGGGTVTIGGRGQGPRSSPSGAGGSLSHGGEFGYVGDDAPFRGGSSASSSTSTSKRNPEIDLRSPWDQEHEPRATAFVFKCAKNDDCTPKTSSFFLSLGRQGPDTIGTVGWNNGMVDGDYLHAGTVFRFRAGGLNTGFGTGVFVRAGTQAINVGAAANVYLLPTFTGELEGSLSVSPSLIGLGSSGLHVIAIGSLGAHENTVRRGVQFGVEWGW